MSSNVASTVHALTLGKAIQLKLDGPETYDRWYDTIINVMKETKCDLSRSGEFRDLSVYQCIFERTSEQAQHAAAQTFTQQLLNSTIEAKNFDLIKSVPQKNPDNEEDPNYNRAKLQLDILKEEHKSQSLPVLSSLYIELENLRVTEFLQKGVKNSVALTLFFQKQAELIHKIGQIPDGKPNMKLLLINTKRHLPIDMRRWAQDATTLEQLRATLVDNSRLWLDDMEAEEQVFVANQPKPRNPKRKSQVLDSKPICWHYAANARCDYGKHCRFAHVRDSPRGQQVPQRPPQQPPGRHGARPPNQHVHRDRQSMMLPVTSGQQPPRRTGARGLRLRDGREIHLQDGHRGDSIQNQVAYFHQEPMLDRDGASNQRQVIWGDDFDAQDSQ
jgi:hypothetical protein